MLVQRKNYTSRGCFACINRKIKCDQQRPSCNRCGRAGLQCPGYRDADELRFRYSLSLATAPPPPNSDLADGRSYNGRHTLKLCVERPVPSLSTQDSSWQEPEAKSLHYFRTLAAQDFQGYLRSEFWSSTVYQKSLHYPAIRHALVAVSDAHQEWMLDPSNNLSFAALTRYGRALRFTVTELQEAKSKDWEAYVVSLYCCILLYYFELFNHNSVAAGVHLDNGLRLLREWRSTASGWPPVELTGTHRTEFFQILYTVGRLESDRSVSGGMSKHPTQNFRLLRDGLQPALTEPPDAFSLGCCLLMLSLYTAIFTRSNSRYLGSCIREIPYEVISNRNFLFDRVDAIMAMLDTFQAQADHDSKSGRQKIVAICIMRLYLLSNKVRMAEMFTTLDSKDPKPYDEYAERMLDVADRASQLRCAPPLRQGFMPEPGIIAPLQRLASQVSNEGHRRHAYAIIDRLNGTDTYSRPPSVS